ncbi:hypothetical protein BS78_07G138400 [Paspalum vaginatum]|nr:hypothetical protein BS78_07G138400 [Paspalum vaginatum]
MYRRGGGGSVLLVGVYVDDLIITGSKPTAVEKFKAEMKGEFLMSDLGLLSFYLGIETHYAKQILESAGMAECNPSGAPLEELLKLSKESTADRVNSTRYRQIVGSLRYLVHTSLTWLSPSASSVDSWSSLEEHDQAVKGLLRYVAGTLNYGLRYERRPGTAQIVGYSDADHGSDIDNRKSTSGTFFFLGNSLISWQSIKQRVVALSSCEAEYIAATPAATQAIWLARLLGELLGREPEAVELKVDSKSALALAKNPVFHERRKHIHIRYHFIRNCLDEGSIKASHVTIENQLADILTKALGRVKFQELRARIGMVKISD